MSQGGYSKALPISTMAAAAVLLAVTFGSRAPAFAIGGGPSADLSLPSIVELVLTTRERRLQQKPKDPPGTWTMRQQCNAGFIYIRTQCLNRWSVRKTEKRC